MHTHVKRSQTDIKDLVVLSRVLSIRETLKSLSLPTKHNEHGESAQDRITAL